MSKPDLDHLRKPPTQVENCALRWMLLAFGWLNVGVGLIGIVIPGLPTTVFLLIALWAFSKSSERFQLWLWNHPKLGPGIRAWHHHRVIPKKAKIAAVCMMSVSLAVVTAFFSDGWGLPLFLAAVMAPAAGYVLSRAGEIPPDSIMDAPIGNHPGDQEA